MNKTDRRANLSISHVICDILFITLSCISAITLSPTQLTPERIGYYFTLLTSFCVIFFLFMMANRMYNKSTFFYLDRVLKLTTVSLAGTLLIVFMFMFMLYNTTFDRVFLLIFMLSASITVNIGKILIIRRKKLTAYGTKVIYVGTEELYEDFLHYTKLSGFNFTVVGYIQIGDETVNDLESLGKIEDFEDILKKHPCNQVIFTKSLSDNQRLSEYLTIAYEMGIVAQIMLDVYKLKGAKWYISSLGTYPILTYYSTSLDPLKLALKRIMDIVGSILGLVISFPILLIAAICIKIESRGPIIFKQERVGKHGQKFRIYKLRSMHVGAESHLKELMDKNEMGGDGKIFKIKKDVRITKVGEFIRKTSIDELPQFLNVLIGNMSLVGTRPPTTYEVEKYDRQHYKRISMKPGITGIWQTSGRNKITDFEDIVKMDVEYIENWTLMLDCVLLLKTLKVVFKKSGAY